MPATTNVNLRTVVHEKSHGLATFFPDVCKTPAPPAPPIPIPYPNIAQSSQMDQGSIQVKIDGSPVMLQGSRFATSTGDEAGSAGGVASNTLKGQAEFVNYSFDVMIEGKNVPRLGDLMVGNKRSAPNTPPMPEVQPPLVVTPPVEAEETEDVQLERLEEVAPEPEEREKEDPRPMVSAMWEKESVTPPHFKEPKKTDPADLPDNSKVKLLVETKNIPDGIDVAVDVIHAYSRRDVTGSAFGKLKVKGNRVIDPATGDAPEWYLPAEEKPWDPWDKPFYFFRARFEYPPLEAETRNGDGCVESNRLRLEYWHACISDEVADDGGLTTGEEAAEIRSILKGQPHHEVNTRAMTEADYQKRNIPESLGEAIRNTFVYHNASHGEKGIIDFCGKRKRDPMQITSLEILNTEITPTVPRFLAYLNCCLTGQNPDFSQALIGRGTRNVIAFKIEIPDREARTMAFLFYSFWSQDHKCNPAKIPKVYKQVSPSFRKNMSPVLYGKGGTSASGGPSLLDIAAIAIGAIAVGVMIGTAASKLLK